MTTLQKTIIGATLAAMIGIGVYEARQVSTHRNRLETLQRQQAPLARQTQQLQRERDDGLRQLAGLREENERLNSNTSELLRLRGEVGVLRRQLESANARNLSGTASSTETGRAAHKPGAYISKEQLVNAGFDTAEAATETYFQAFWSGDFRQLTNALSAQLRADLEAQGDAKAREEFDRKSRQQDISSGIQGIQLLAKKVADDRVDVEVLVFEAGKPPETLITKLLKEGNSWKVGGLTSDSNWKADWKDGHFETLTPAANP